MFCEIKSAAFKINILTCLLLYRSLGNIIHNIAANANGLPSVSGIRNLEKCYKKRNKALFDKFLKKLIIALIRQLCIPFSFH